jgi:ATP-dependent RNA helicase DDX35
LCWRRPLKLRIHNSSVLARVKPAYVVFLTAQRSEGGWYEMQGVTAITKELLLDVAPHMYQSLGLRS